MVTKLAHGSELKLDTRNDRGPVHKDNINLTKHFSETFGDFVSSCLLTDPKKVSAKSIISNK